MEFTSREIATGVIVTGIVLLVLSIHKDRKKLLLAFLRVLKALAQWKVWTVVLAYLGFLGAVVTLAHHLGLWSCDLLKDTLIVGFFVGLPILLRSPDFKAGPEVVKHVTKQVLGITALLVVYVNLTSFPLGGELILQVTLLLFTMFAIVAKRDPTTAAVGKIFEVLTSLIVLGLLINVTVQILVAFNELDWEREVTTFAMSVWLPISLIPFIYLFGLVAACESALVIAKVRNRGEKLPRRVRLGFLHGVHGSLRYASSFKGMWLPELASQRSWRRTLRLMRKYRQTVRQNARRNSERRRRLRRNAGERGVDENGLWLDRREFHETKEALERLFFSQMGLYRNRGGRYWTDPVVIFPLRGFQDLPEDHRVRLGVRDDGQAWVAWRQTAGGFFLAVGGTSDLDAYWRYAGTDAPTEYPSKDSEGWVDISARPDASPEWMVDDGPVELTYVTDLYSLDRGGSAAV